MTMLTDEQWERLIQWHRKRCGKEVTQALLSAREFEVSMKKIATLAGHTQEEFEALSSSLLNMAESEPVPRDLISLETAILEAARDASDNLDELLVQAAEIMDEDRFNLLCDKIHQIQVEEVRELRGWKEEGHEP